MKKAVFLFIALSVLNISCRFDSSGQYTYHPPENINDGLDVGTLEEIHTNGHFITKAVDRIYHWEI